MDNPIATFVSGVIWIAIFIGVGIFGQNLGGAMGAITSWIGFLLAGFSLLYLIQMIIKFATGAWSLKRSDQDDNEQ